MLLWIGFIVCTAVIVYSGSRLSRYGDVIAEKTGLGRTWVGVVLLASITSLPELATGLSSVTYANAPNIAIGDVLGSCVFNVLIIAILDAFYPVIPLSAKAHQGNILTGAFGILLLSFVAISLCAGRHIAALGWIAPFSLLFFLLYFFAIRLVFTYEKRSIAAYVKERAIELKYQDITLKTAVTNYAFNALIVVVAAIFLPGIGKGIAEVTGLGQTFVGNIFIAISTSLPELVVSITAIRMNAIDLAIGNLFGSNIFNIVILGLDDLFFIKGPIYHFADLNHVISAFAAIAMLAIAIIGLMYRAEKKRLLLAWDSIGIVLIYVTNIYLLYTLR